MVSQQYTSKLFKVKITWVISFERKPALGGIESVFTFTILVTLHKG